MMAEAYYVHFTGLVGKPWQASAKSVEAAAAGIQDAEGREAWTQLYKMYWQESSACQPGGAGGRSAASPAAPP